MELVNTLPEGVEVISLVVWQDMVVCATTKGVYICRDPKGRFEPVTFVDPDWPEASK